MTTFIDKLIDKQVEVKSMSPEERRLKRLEEVIEARRQEAWRLAMQLKDLFFFRTTEEIQTNDPINVGGYSVERIHKSNKQSIIDFTNQQNAYIGNVFVVGYGYAYDKESDDYYLRSRYSRVNYDLKIKYYDDIVMRITWYESTYSYESRYSITEWAMDDGDWYPELLTAIQLDNKDAKKAAKEAVEQAKKEMVRKAAASRIKELESKYGVSVARDGRVLHSKEEIDLERYREDALADMNGPRKGVIK